MEQNAQVLVSGTQKDFEKIFAAWHRAYLAMSSEDRADAERRFSEQTPTEIGVADAAFFVELAAEYFKTTPPQIEQLPDGASVTRCT
jgi:hypothetical protein